MKFLYELNFNDSSESTIKEFFKKFLAERNEMSHEEKHASYSPRLVLFFGDRDDTITGFDDWFKENEYEDIPVHSIISTKYNFIKHKNYFMKNIA